MGEPVPREVGGDPGFVEALVTGEEEFSRPGQATQVGQPSAGDIETLEVRAVLPGTRDQGKQRQCYA